MKRGRRRLRHLPVMVLGLAVACNSPADGTASKLDEETDAAAVPAQLRYPRLELVPAHVQQAFARVAILPPLPRERVGSDLDMKEHVLMKAEEYHRWLAAPCALLCVACDLLIGCPKIQGGGAADAESPLLARATIQQLELELTQGADTVRAILPRLDSEVIDFIAARIEEIDRSVDERSANEELAKVLRDRLTDELDRASELRGILGAADMILHQRIRAVRSIGLTIYLEEGALTDSVVMPHLVEELSLALGVSPGSD